MMVRLLALMVCLLACEARACYEKPDPAVECSILRPEKIPAPTFLHPIPSDVVVNNIIFPYLNFEDIRALTRVSKQTHLAMGPWWVIFRTMKATYAAHEDLKVRPSEWELENFPESFRALLRDANYYRLPLIASHRDRMFQSLELSVRNTDTYCVLGVPVGHCFYCMPSTLEKFQGPHGRDNNQFLLYGSPLKSFPQFMVKFSHLEELELENALLTSVPEALASMTNLSKLWLRGNRLTWLPESMSGMTNLEALDLGDNLFSSCPQWLSKLVKLQRLDLSDNQLDSIPESTLQLTNLVLLWLTNNPIHILPVAWRDRDVVRGFEGKFK